MRNAAMDRRRFLETSGTGGNLLGKSLVGSRVRAGCSGALALLRAEYGADTMIRGDD
jgi:hypothetical protein